jgi:hypothetical protein
MVGGQRSEAGLHGGDRAVDVDAAAQLHLQPSQPVFLRGTFDRCCSICTRSQGARHTYASIASAIDYRFPKRWAIGIKRRSKAFRSGEELYPNSLRLVL